MSSIINTKSIHPVKTCTYHYYHYDYHYHYYYICFKKLTVFSHMISQIKSDLIPEFCSLTSGLLPSAKETETCLCWIFIQVYEQHCDTWKDIFSFLAMRNLKFSDPENICAFSSWICAGAPIESASVEFL